MKTKKEIASLIQDLNKCLLLGEWEDENIITILKKYIEIEE